MTICFMQSSKRRSNAGSLREAGIRNSSFIAGEVEKFGSSFRFANGDVMVGGVLSPE